MTHPTDTRLPTREDLAELRGILPSFDAWGDSELTRALMALPSLLAAAERALRLEDLAKELDGTLNYIRATRAGEAAFRAMELEERCRHLEEERDRDVAAERERCLEISWMIGRSITYRSGSTGNVLPFEISDAIRTGKTADQLRRELEGGE